METTWDCGVLAKCLDWRIWARTHSRGRSMLLRTLTALVVAGIVVSISVYVMWGARELRSARFAAIIAEALV